MTNEERCFPFYSGGPTCQNCVVSKRCKAILVSDGFDMIAAFLEEMLTDLPNTEYKDTDRVSELATQLLKPPVGELYSEGEEVLLHKLHSGDDLTLDDL